MSITTKFEEWLDCVETTNYEEIYSLYQSAKLVEDWNFFSTTEKPTSKGNQYFIKCSYIDELLLLASEKAKDAFLKYIEARYCDGSDIESWYGYMHSMSKND